MSLAQLLVAVALSAVMLTGLWSALDEGQRVYASGSAQAEIAQSSRIALQRLAKEIREAGYGPHPERFSAIAQADASTIVLQQDVDGDGQILANGETITWLLRGNVLRRNAGGGAQPIINGVTRFLLTYRDARGALTTRLDDIRLVQVQLTVGAAVPSMLSATAPYTVATQVRLRNR
jgi:Tfp pilus assembly protein PilW